MCNETYGYMRGKIFQLMLGLFFQGKQDRLGAIRRGSLRCGFYKKRIKRRSEDLNQSVLKRKIFQLFPHKKLDVFNKEDIAQV